MLYVHIDVSVLTYSCVMTPYDTSPSPAPHRSTANAPAVSHVLRSGTYKIIHTRRVLYTRMFPPRCGEPRLRGHRGNRIRVLSDTPRHTRLYVYIYIYDKHDVVPRDTTNVPYHLLLSIILY